jgi:hypothetical protein
VEKVGNYLKEDLAKPGYKSKHESTKRWGWLEWRSHGLPTSIYNAQRQNRSYFSNYGRMKRSGLKWIVQKYRKRLTLTSGVCAETESVILFQLWTDEKKWIEMDRPKVQKAANTYFWCMRRDRIGKTFPTMDG